MTMLGTRGFTALPPVRSAGDDGCCSLASLDRWRRRNIGRSPRGCRWLCERQLWLTVRQPNSVGVAYRWQDCGTDNGNRDVCPSGPPARRSVASPVQRPRSTLALSSRALLPSHCRQGRVDEEIQIETRPLVGVEDGDFVAVAERDQGQVVADGDALCSIRAIRITVR